MSFEIREGAELVPGYRLVHRLGRGGFGEVWKVDGPGNQSVALKIIELATPQSDEELQALVVVSSVRHPHLLHILGHWVSDQHLLIASELADGTAADLARVHHEQGRAGVPRPELLRIMAQTAEALDYLNANVHEHAGRRVSIQHRDVKPENIFLFGQHVRVGDFGLVKVLEQVTARHSGRGTLVYSPPEMLEGKVSHASDQYSLALTYCQLRVGNLPFSGDTALEKLWSRVKSPPNLDEFPPEERPVILQALSRDPNDRFPSCQTFVEALAAAPAADETTGARRDPFATLGRTTASLPRVPASPRSASDSGPLIKTQPLPSGFAPIQGAAIHESGYPAEIICEIDGAEMVLVPEGEFQSGPRLADGALKRVFLSRYYIDKYPVTNAQFQWFGRQTGYSRADRWGWGDDGAGLVNKSAHPAVWVSWEDASAYCQWAGKALPTEAQWEKANRGVDGRNYPWGDMPPEESEAILCNGRYLRESSSHRTSPVGAFPDGMSPYGCHDLVGNVWQWCQDWFDPHPPPGGYRNPKGPPTGRFRSIRGGSWANTTRMLAASFRNHLAPESRGPTVGFRGVLCLTEC